MSKSLWGMGLSLLVAAGCSSDEGPTFALPFCTGSGARLNLAVGSCSVVDPLVTGDSAVFPANTTGSQMEYVRSEEHTSELQSRLHLVCRLLLEKKKNSAQKSSRWHSHCIKPRLFETQLNQDRQH